VHDLEAGRLALLLRLVSAGKVHDLVDVLGQVGRGEQAQELAHVKAGEVVEDKALLDRGASWSVDVELLNKGLERVADEGAGGVEQVAVHDLEAGRLALLLRLVSAGKVHDLVDVLGQVGRGEQAQELAHVKAGEVVEQEALGGRGGAFLQVELVHQDLERVADEGAGGVEELGGHDLEAGRLALLLRLIGASEGHDLIDVVRQVSRGEQLFQLG